MELNLKKPIIFFDLETTGLDLTKDRVIELSYIKVYPNGKEEEKTLRFNPEIPIKPDAMKVHGITDEELKDKPTFKSVAKELARTFQGCNVAGFNSNRFDVPLLLEEFYRADVDIDRKNMKFIDVQTIFHKMEPRTLAAAHVFYCGCEIENAHSANADTKATYEVLKAQLDRYPELQNDMEYLADFSSFNKNVDFSGRFIYNETGEEVINFGKYKGRLVEEVFAKEPNYYNWMMDGDFSYDTKAIARSIYMRVSFKKLNAKG